MSKRYRYIFPPWLKDQLEIEYGIVPDLEREDYKNPGNKCWVYKNTKALEDALDSIMGKEDHYNG